MSKRKKIKKKRSLLKRRQQRQQKKLSRTHNDSKQSEVRSPSTWKKKTKLRERVKVERNRLQNWYLDQSTTMKIGLSLIIIPILVTLFLLQGVILPVLAAFFGIAFTVSKVAFLWLKGGAFIVYISYKVFKGLLGVYYCVSRSLSGWKAYRLRREQAQLPVHIAGEYPELRLMRPTPTPVTLEASLKYMTLQYKDYHLPILYSYLRYFIIGQLFMYRSFWVERMSFLTIWRKSSRTAVKGIFTLIGQTIFTPHLLGPHLNKNRLLVPGDACFIQYSPPNDDGSTSLLFEITWQEWSFQKSWPFVVATPQNREWIFEVPSSLASLSEDEVGYIQVPQSPTLVEEMKH